MGLVESPDIADTLLIREEVAIRDSQARVVILEPQARSLD